MAKKKKRQHEELPSWNEYEKLMTGSSEDHVKRARDAYDDLLAARVVACSVLGPDASEDAILRVFDALVRRQAFSALKGLRGKPDEIV